jgi:MFS family permease
MSASTSSASGRLGSRGRRALGAGMTIVVTGAIPGFLAASLAPRIRHDFAFGDSALGAAAAVFYIVSMAFSPALGRLVGRIGPEQGMRVSVAATVGACLGIATLVHSALALALLLALAGVGNAMASPAVSTMLKHEIAGERQGMAFGAQQSGASLGALLAGLALPLVGIPLGWRWAYLGVALLALGAVAFAPRGVPHVEPSADRGHRRGLTSVHALGLASALASAAGVGFISFLVTYSVDNGISEAAAGLLLGGLSLCATVSRLVLGLLADRRGQEPLAPLAALFALAAGAYLLLIPGSPALIVAAAVLIGVLGWSWPGALNLAVVQRSPDAPAWGVGVMMTGLFAGAVAGPLVIGLLAEHDHFAAAWMLCAGLVLLAAATVALVLRSSGNARREGDGYH